MQKYSHSIVILIECVVYICILKARILSMTCWILWIQSRNVSYIFIQAFSFLNDGTHFYNKHQFFDSIFSQCIVIWIFKKMIHFNIISQCDWTLRVLYSPKNFHIFFFSRILRAGRAFDHSSFNNKHIISNFSR